MQCFDERGYPCDDIVTPIFLHNADGQNACHEDGYCVVRCNWDNSQVFWSWQQCKPGNPCPPYGLTHWTELYDENPLAENFSSSSYQYDIPFPESMQSTVPFNNLIFSIDEIQFMENVRSLYDNDTTKFLVDNGYNLRGAECEILDGKEVCFISRNRGRFVLCYL